ncbi:MAG: hypothetical protein ACRELF_03180 [Gemmataceae bacterium]
MPPWGTFLILAGVLAAVGVPGLLIGYERLVTIPERQRAARWLEMHDLGVKWRAKMFGMKVKEESVQSYLQKAREALERDPSLDRFVAWRDDPENGDFYNPWKKYKRLASLRQGEADEINQESLRRFGVPAASLP